ncbi:hypothetical protein shim_23610 [Shimia sp. SK013]|uniref:hypothetical protein n=1 Tax=Shimia sp. SK013 TaxID=1389006 RepID=UPI0006B54450|nr:hypothetical protein [Shimia sp. SK013]KPA21654.1 hypothetical protein shim_23610 [Shimia sp. SK013]
MRAFGLFLLTIFFAVTGPTQALAQNTPTFGTSKSLTFVDKTGLTDMNGAALDLCHLAQGRSLLGQGVWVTSKGYVLAPNECLSDDYFTLTGLQLLQAQNEGDIAAEVPVTPDMNEAQMIDRARGYSLLALIGGVFALLGMVAFVILRRRAAVRRYYATLSAEEEAVA